MIFKRLCKLEQYVHLSVCRHTNCLQPKKAVKEIARGINKQIYTSEGKVFLVACMNILKVNSVKTMYMVMASGQ
jgi:hypothetical protein